MFGILVHEKSVGYGDWNDLDMDGDVSYCVWREYDEPSATEREYMLEVVFESLEEATKAADNLSQEEGEYDHWIHAGYYDEYNLVVVSSLYRRYKVVELGRSQSDPVEDEVDATDLELAVAEDDGVRLSMDEVMRMCLEAPDGASRRLH